MTAAALREEPAAAPVLLRPLSPSQVSQFLDCQARWYYSHVAQLPDPQTGALALGRAVHSTAAAYFNLRGQGETLNASDIGNYFAQVFRTELASAELREDEDPARLLDEGLRMLDMFTGQIAPQIQPAAVELQIHGKIGSQHVRGIADVIDEHGVIWDLKTSTKKPGSIGASHMLQLVTYGMLAGKKETRLVTMARTKTPSWNQHSLTLTPAHTQYVVTMYDMAADSMQSGLYLPNRGSNLCSRKNCAFWRACQAEYGGCVE